MAGCGEDFKTYLFENKSKSGAGYGLKSFARCNEATSGIRSDRTCAGGRPANRYLLPI
jgi:hypothetical protein